MTAGAAARLRRWQVATWAVFAAIYFWSHFQRVAPAVIAADLMAAFGTTGAELGTLSAIYPYVFALMALPAGALAETVGSRRLIAWGGLTMGAGALVFALAPRFAVAFAGRLLVGLGGAVLLVAFLRLCAEWFRPEQFATLTGLTQVIGSVGALIAARPLALLVDGIGWRASFALVGAATALLAGAWWGVARDRPEERGLPPVSPGRGHGGPRGLAALGEVARRSPASPATRAAGRPASRPPGSTAPWWPSTGCGRSPT